MWTNLILYGCLQVVAPITKDSFEISGPWESASACGIPAFKIPRPYIKGGVLLPGRVITKQGSTRVETTSDLREVLSASEVVQIAGYSVVTSGMIGCDISRLNNFLPWQIHLELRFSI